jgi:hypothetical protein
MPAKPVCVLSFFYPDPCPVTLRQGAIAAYWSLRPVNSLAQAVLEIVSPERGPKRFRSNTFELAREAGAADRLEAYPAQEDWPHPRTSSPPFFFFAPRFTFRKLPHKNIRI